MSEPFVGEIRMFAGNFAPRGYALCDGQLLSVSQNDALYSLFGTFYGGDGRTTFGLPDLRGRLPLHAGGSAGPGLTQRSLASRGGEESVTLAASEMPSHSHTFKLSTERANSASPVGNSFATSASGDWQYGEPGTGSSVLAGAGGSSPHDNMPPFLCINFIVALVGIYPSRT